MNTTSLPDHTRLPGHHYSLGEMRGFIADMRVINAQFYNLCFLGRMGSSCHAFIEFAGMQAKFIDMCQEALDAGIEFPFANQHSRTPWPIQRHHAEYLGEKFQCIYGFAIGPNKELRDAFIESGLGAEKQSSIERGKDDEEGSEEGIGEEDSSEEGVRSEDGRPEVTKEAGGQEEDVATVRRGERDHRGHDERGIVDARDRKEDRTRPVDGLEMAAGHLSSDVTLGELETILRQRQYRHARLQWEDELFRVSMQSSMGKVEGTGDTMIRAFRSMVEHWELLK